MVVVGYGQIIPQSIIDIPRYGIINVHASLLPKYRGAAPIQWAIANGETRTGVTTMRIDAGLDTGDMLLKWETEIGPEENAVELGERLARSGRGSSGRNARGIEAGTIRPEPQDNSASHARADPEKRRRRDRLELAGAKNLQPRARISAVAGRVQLLSRPDVSYLESARGRRSAATAIPGRLHAAQEAAAGRPAAKAPRSSCSKFKSKAASECRPKRF